MSKMETTITVQSNRLYRAVWRWHFYAGLLVIPFLLVLSLTGLLMLISKPVEPWLYQKLMTVEPTGTALPASTLLATVQARYPDGAVQLYLPPRAATEAAQFSVLAHAAAGHTGHNMPSITVYLNPYNGKILGMQDPAKTLYARLKTLHGTLFMGDVGDALIEIAAGLAVLMVVGGLYLAWPRTGGDELSPPRRLARRDDWRQLHRVIGLMVALPLLLFLISGLAWTNVWGGQLVQVWSSLPGAFEAPRAEQTHESMNQEGLHQVPWAMEQTPLPMSSTGAEEMSLDTVTNIAQQQGFVNYRVRLPQGERGVWTISATTIAGDVTNPLAERTLHLDRHSGKVLADLKFADYPIIGKAMASFVPLHQGDLGRINWVLNFLFVAMVTVMIISGIILWWKRRPSRERKLAPPSAPAAVNRAVVVTMLIVAVCFPLSAAALAVVIIVDWLLISRVNVLRTALK